MVREDSLGVYIESRLWDVPAARTLVDWWELGSMNSMGAKPGWHFDKSTAEVTKDLRTIITMSRADVYEISLTTNPAFQETVSKRYRPSANIGPSRRQMSTA